MLHNFYNIFSALTPYLCLLLAYCDYRTQPMYCFLGDLVEGGLRSLDHWTARYIYLLLWPIGEKPGSPRLPVLGLRKQADSTTTLQRGRKEGSYLLRCIPDQVALT